MASLVSKSLAVETMLLLPQFPEFWVYRAEVPSVFHHILKTRLVARCPVCVQALPCSESHTPDSALSPSFAAPCPEAVDSSPHLSHAFPSPVFPSILFRNSLLLERTSAFLQVLDYEDIPSLQMRSSCLPMVSLWPC